MASVPLTPSSRASARPLTEGRGDRQGSEEVGDVSASLALVLFVVSSLVPCANPAAKDFIVLP